MPIAIIGTAGRDKAMKMNRDLWDWMVQDAIDRVPKGAHLISGGAAWADHLAVHLYLVGHASRLTLRLPAPFENNRYVGPWKSSASAANYYHQRFSDLIREKTLKQIGECIQSPNCDGSVEPAEEGYSGMFTRNQKVAREATEMLAYTFGQGDRPADGGTAHTWDRFVGPRQHISLPIL